MVLLEEGPNKRHTDQLLTNSVHELGGKTLRRELQRRGEFVHNVTEPYVLLPVRLNFTHQAVFSCYMLFPQLCNLQSMPRLAFPEGIRRDKTLLVHRRARQTQVLYSKHNPALSKGLESQRPQQLASAPQ